jgi:hypothetical protein
MQVGDIYEVTGSATVRVFGIVSEVNGDYFDGWEVWLALGSGRLLSFQRQGRFVGANIVPLEPRRLDAAAPVLRVPTPSGNNSVDLRIGEATAAVDKVMGDRVGEDWP